MFHFDTSAVWSVCCWRWTSSGCLWGDLICQSDSVLLIWRCRLVTPKVTYLNLWDLLAGFHSKIKAFFFSLFICIWACGPHQLAPFCPFPFDSIEDSGRNASQNRLLKESEQLISALLDSWFSAFLLVWLWGKPVLNFLCHSLAALKLSKIQISVLTVVLAGIVLISFLVAGTLLYFEFSIRTTLITLWWFGCC